MYKQWSVNMGLAAACLGGLVCSPFCSAADSIESFSPQGTVKEVRQVTARFSGQMVAFGDLRLSDPFTIDCPEHGKGRWVDGSNWSYDFDRDLPAGVSCSFTLKPELKTLEGKAIEGTTTYLFSTGGPSIIGSEPAEGSMGIDENQVFILALDAVAQAESIEQNAYCSAAGVNEKIGVRLLTGQARDDILMQRESFMNRHLNVYFKARGVLWRSAINLKNHKMDKLPLVVLQCKRSLPAKAKLSLIWGAGIRSDSGIANSADQTLAYEVRPNFSATFACQRTSIKGPCIPLLPMQLTFSSPVKKDVALAIRLTAEDGKIYRPSFDEYEVGSPIVSSISFVGPFPEKTTFALSVPPEMKDDIGRKLQNRKIFPLAVRTDEQPPLLKFPSRFGILEAHGDRMLPVTVRNIEATLKGRIAGSSLDANVNGNMLKVDDQDEKIITWMKRLSDNTYNSDRGNWHVGETWNNQMESSIFDGAGGSKGKAFSMPKPNGKEEFEVVGIPLQKPGFYVVELQSPKLGKMINQNGGTAYVQSSALVTNLAAHFKHGAESSLVWVTSLDKGTPVNAAKVAVRDCRGNLLWHGETDQNGVARITQTLPTVKCGYNEEYFISARSGEDMTFTLSGWTGGIELWRFNVPTEPFDRDNVMVDTVFDRTLFRVGEIVHMKHFLRKHDSEGIRFAQTGNAQKLILTHDGSNQHFELPVTWSANGTAENTWIIPADAKQGTYSLMIGNYQAGSFRVEAFRVPTMKAILQGPKTAAVQVPQLDVDIQLNYLAGGGASGASVKLRSMLEDRSISFDDYEGITFSNGDVKEGKTRDAPTFDEDSATWDDDTQSADDASAAHGAAKTQLITLDRQGAARATIKDLPKLTAQRTLLTELEFQDANGETSTVSSRIPLWSSSYQIGLKPDAWAVSKDAFKFQVIVVDVNGRPIANAAVTSDFFQRKNYAHRHRLIGGFYAYENVSEVKLLGSACEGKTDNKGILFCSAKAPASGNLILRAKTSDDAGRAVFANAEVWVAGNENWWFNITDNDRIDLLPEKKHYEPGQDATFQVRMPFREATALVTVEREGILDTYVRHLTAKQPVFTIPVKGNYAPNVFVSALVVRGRVAGVQPTALVDLGKPAYKMGLTTLQVGWQAHALNVKVEPDKLVYKVRDKAKVHVSVTRADGSKPPAGSEVAIAAVDTGLLELMPNDSWDLLEAMMQQRSLQVQTSTAQMQVIGKRHFGRKAVPHGGGGGKGNGRELFDTLLFWKGRVVLDANGEANIEVPLNDSLTAFRIVAIASGNADLFGTGKTDIRSTQDLILMSGLPGLVREDDQFRAGFTLRNTSEAAMTVDLNATVANPDNAKAVPVKLAPQQIRIEAGQASEVGWNYRVPVGANNLAWDVVARSADGANTDRIKIKQKVMVGVPVRTYQATLMQLEKPITMSVQMPQDALPGRGGVQTRFQAKLGSDLPGVREYMLAYPYSCFEQRTSKAVTLHDATRWKENMAILPTYLDEDGLVKYFPMMRQGSDTLTAYVLSVADEAGYKIPDEVRQHMESALIGFVEGKVNRDSQLPTADLAIRKMAALEALSRTGKVAPVMFDSITVEPNLWPTSAVIDWYLVLKRTPDLPERDTKMVQAENILRSHMNFQGTTMGFSTERRDDLWWLMISGDVNANRILLAMEDNARWRNDIGRLVRGTLGRQHKGRWNTTVANAWGVLAMEKFSEKFESVPVSGSSSVKLGRDTKTIDWAKQSDGTTVMQAWPAGQSDDWKVEHTGAGKPWVTISSLAAIPLKSPLSSGYKIVKTVTPVEQQKPGNWSRGDVYRVHLEIEAQSDMTWVVVDDPIPASATILGNGLGRDSQIMASGERQQGWAWPAYTERSFDAYRSYFEFVPKGTWSVDYTVRLNNQGDFTLPSTRVEAMYAPEMFGEVPNEKMHVNQ